MIYFAQAGEGGPIKVGQAIDVSFRLAALQSANASCIILLGQFDGGFEEETRLHKLLKPLRIRGEWYSPHESIFEAIKAGPRQTPFPIQKIPHMTVLTNEEQASVRALFQAMGQERARKQYLLVGREAAKKAVRGLAMSNATAAQVRAGLKKVPALPFYT